LPSTRLIHFIIGVSPPRVTWAQYLGSVSVAGLGKEKAYLNILARRGKCEKET
jgi:hypothetical protein